MDTRAALHIRMLASISEVLKRTLEQHWDRELALTYHPDKGGTRHDMQALNAACRVVKDYLGYVSFAKW